MKIYVGKGNATPLCIEHKGEVLEFGQAKDTFSDKDYAGKMSREVQRREYGKLLFKELNAYWKTLPEVDLDRLFDIYVKALETIEDSPSKIERLRHLQRVVTELIDTFHQLEDVHEFILTQNIKTSDKVKDEFVQSEHGSISVDTTYVTEQYLELAAMTVVFHAVSPIWVYCAEVGNEGRQNHFYEMEMYNLLKLSTVMDSSPMIKLEDYLKAWVDKETQTGGKAAATVLGTAVAGIGTSDIPLYVTAIIIVEKLAHRTLDIEIEKGDLVTHVYRRVKNILRKLASKFSNIQERVEIKSGDDDDKNGYLEGFRAREKVRRDVIVLNRVYCRDYRALKRAIDPDIPTSLVKDCLYSISTHLPLPARKHQMVLMQWVLHRKVHAKTIGQLHRDEFLKAMAVTAAALIHWKLKPLAVMLLSTPVKKDESVIVMTTTARVTAENRERLASVYELAYNSKTTKRVPGVHSIDTYAALVSDQFWKFEATKTIEQEVGLKSGEYKPDHDLRGYLAQLLILINK